jgi:hypothetical protein
MRSISEIEEKRQGYGRLQRKGFRRQKDVK